MRECIVAACTNEGTVLMSINALGGHDEKWFCERCAKRFGDVWVRVDAEPEQMSLL